MKNVILPTEEYTFFREWTRKQPIKWRDMSSGMSIPSWGEATLDKAYTIGNKSCAEVAYDLLTQFYPHLHLKWRKEELKLLDRRPPRLFQGPFVGLLFYIDIKASFHQFYRYLFLHSDYPYKAQRYPLSGIAQEFIGRTENEWKIARNALPGICRSTKNKWVFKERVWTTPKINKYLSPTLWAQLMGIHNQIASDMYKVGAIWFNTDGYIFSSEEAYIKALQYFEEREITIGDTGSGIGSITGINSVNIPGVKTTKCNVQSKEVYHLEAEDIDHLYYWNLNRKAIN